MAVVSVGVVIELGLKPSANNISVMSGLLLVRKRGKRRTE